MSLVPVVRIQSWPIAMAIRRPLCTAVAPASSGQASQSCHLGTRNHLTLLLLQSPHPTISACSPCSWVQPLCDPTSYVVLSCPGLWIYVTNTRSSSSSFQDHGHMSGDSHSSRAGIPPSPTGWKGSSQNMCISKYFCKFYIHGLFLHPYFYLWTKDQNVELLIEFWCSLLVLSLGIHFMKDFFPG